MPYRQKIYSMQLSHYRMTGGQGESRKHTSKLSMNTINNTKEFPKHWTGAQLAFVLWILHMFSHFNTAKVLKSYNCSHKPCYSIVIITQITYMCQVSYCNIVSHSYLPIYQLKYKQLFYPRKQPEMR